jgi:hypothetical protein
MISKSDESDVRTKSKTPSPTAAPVASAAHYIQIAGPVTTTFPSPEGWTTVQPSKTITNLAHLPIITEHYTEPHIQ